MVSLRINRSTFLLTSICLSILFLPSAMAQTPAVSVINQFASANSTATFGWHFVTGIEPITVMSLGFWDNGADGLALSHEVGIWDLATQTLQGSTFVSAGVADPIDAAGWRYNTGFTPFELDPNTDYVIGALTLAASDVLGFLSGPDATNVTVASGIASFVGGRFVSSAAFAFPSNAVSPGRYFGPNFEFVLSEIAIEPTSMSAAKSFFSLER